ncbi:lytic murein transglycosylase [Alteromonas sp. 345S023]|uniref:Lytic murein transglycosylase n=1 Tax=Alteromonas profundi TaxID=2696062 RepID=A0A7X5RLP8_9ALTE|nr:lytic murein transglycosylase [Alteromonas profundi]NDV91949.1 lytic murein transglycosylase [Alteromonas profundi]
MKLIGLLTRATLILAFVALSCQSVAAQQKNAEGFKLYLQTLAQEAKQKGFDEGFIDTVLTGVAFRPTVIKSDKNQPEKKITLDSYLATRVPDWKVKQAVDAYHKHKALLEKIGREYNVQPRFIVALWGNESNFGRIQGKYSVLSSLASLAYEGRRERLFKENFFAALRILEQGHISAEKLTGSWAGAMGQSQFMPVSFLNYAVDYDGDGKKDIWGTPADVFASIANYLSTEGWDGNGTWGRQVTLTAPIDEYGLAKSKRRSLIDWQQAGVRRFDGTALPNVDIEAALIMPDGKDGRIYLVYNNFQTLMKWNRSSYFGVSVGYLSERIKRGN